MNSSIISHSVFTYKKSLRWMILLILLVLSNCRLYNGVARVGEKKIMLSYVRYLTGISFPMTAVLYCDEKSDYLDCQEVEVSRRNE